MFDRITHVHEDHSGPSRIDVHEHRAPTDQSIKLLTDMEEKAQARLLSMVRLDNNDLKLIWHVSKTHYDDTLHIDCQMLLNGKRHHFSLEVHQTTDLNNYKMAALVRERTIEYLSSILAEDLFNAIPRRV